MTIYNKSSPYYLTSLDKGYLDVANFREFPSQDDDILFTVTADYQYRPDLLAYDLYKDEKLWWVFSVRNRALLKDPIFDLVAGANIYLPKKSTLKTYLGT